MAKLDHLIRVEAPDLASWRDWLAHHYLQPDSIWLVRWKKGRGPHLPYADARDEALCWGWIDSLPRRLDEDRSMLLMSPRRPGSAWSAINRARAEVLIGAGRMQKPGLASIQRSKADGGWARLQPSDDLAVPPDLADALAAQPDARSRFDQFAPSSRRAILEWLALARRPETRACRTAEIAARAAEGLRANFPESRVRAPGSSGGGATQP